MILPLGNMQTFIIFYKDIYLSIANKLQIS